MAERDRRTDERAGSEGGFLQRWSRRKAEARSAAVEPAEEPEEAQRQAPDEPAPVDPADLPDIDSLDADSDFSVFMRPGVPEHLRTQALRKMWRTDPLFSRLDGLVEYGEDYSIPSWPKNAIRTVYQVGRGFVNTLEKAGGAEPAAEAAEPSAPPAGDAAAIAAGAAGEPPAKTGQDPSGSGVESPQRQVEATPPAKASVPERPRRRPLPPRG